MRSILFIEQTGGFSATTNTAEVEIPSGEYGAAIKTTKGTETSFEAFLQRLGEDNVWYTLRDAAGSSALSLFGVVSTSQAGHVKPLATYPTTGRGPIPGGIYRVQIVFTGTPDAATAIRIELIPIVSGR